MRFVRYVAFATTFAVVTIAVTPSIDVPNDQVEASSSSLQSISSDDSGREDTTDGILEAMFFDFPLPGGIGGSGGGGVVDGSRGWMARWLALGGEGEVIIRTSNRNITYPHRTAAFPSHLSPSQSLPLSGLLRPFASFPTLPSSTPSSPPSSPSRKPNTAQACLSPSWPPIRWSPPPLISGPRKGDRGVNIALVERGKCDFATKVLAAQERGAGAVIVGDTAEVGETREEGSKRVGGLITMFSPGDTDVIHIPSVFVSRAAYLDLLDMIDDSVEGGVWLEIGDGADENATLGGMLSFALLMPSCFLLATIAIHRVRVSRQKDKDRAPPELVLSLPERVWQPDIVWEKDDSPLSSPSPAEYTTPKSSRSDSGLNTSRRPSPQRTPSKSGSGLSPQKMMVPISAKDILTPPSTEISNPFDHTTPTASGSGIRPTQERSRSSATITGVNSLVPPKATHKRRYFSKDECAICMDEFHAGDIVRILPCGHVFHKEECDEWLMKWRKLCPTCRADVTLPFGVTPQGSIRLTPVDGHHATGDLEEGEGYQGGLGAGDGPMGSLVRATSGFLSRTSGRLFGRRARNREGSDETTPLVRQEIGTEVRRGEGSV